MHARKRIEIVMEAVRAEDVTAWLDDLGATGWTLLPVKAGRGRQGLRRGGMPGGVFDNVVIVCIVSEEVAARLVENQADLLGARPAIVTISDCVVLRGDRFV
jgi:nitrogen regulatory protein PII